MSLVLMVMAWTIAGVIAAETFGKYWGVKGYSLGFLLGFISANVLTWLLIRFAKKAISRKKNGPSQRREDSGNTNIVSLPCNTN